MLVEDFIKLALKYKQTAEEKEPDLKINNSTMIVLYALGTE